MDLQDLKDLLQKQGAAFEEFKRTNDDLIKAKEHPEKYQNLIVRIGGFSARFVELDPIVQEEIIRRTTFAS